MEQVFYIIEHPTRGTFREMDTEWRAGKRIDIPRFSTSGARNDPEKAQQFRTFDQALAMLKRIQLDKSKSLMKSVIRRAPEYFYWCRECGNFIDYSYGNPKGHNEQTCPVYLEWLHEKVGDERWAKVVAERKAAAELQAQLNLRDAEVKKLTPVEKGPVNNFIVTIKHRHDLDRHHPDYNANRYETFGPYTEEQADKVADKMVETGYRVLIHQLGLWPM